MTTVGTQQFAIQNNPAVGPASLGKNQLGLGGQAYYTNIQPYNNWVKTGNAPQFTLNMAGIIDSFSSYTLTGGTVIVQAHTRVPHGLWNPDWSTQQPVPINTGGIGGWSTTVSNTRQGGANGTPLISWNGTHNDSTNVTGPQTLEWAAAPGTGTPDYADLSVLIDAGKPPNMGSSAFGAFNNPNQFLDANFDLQANIANVTSAVFSQILYTLDTSNGAMVPPGFSRAGQNFSIQWAAGTGPNSTVGGVNGTSPAVINQTWNSGLDATSYSITINIPQADIGNPPKQIFAGPNNVGSTNAPTGELALWNSGIYCNPVYESMHTNTCGTVRSMDWFGTNGNTEFNDFTKWQTPTSWITQSARQEPNPIPLAVFTQFCNRTVKNGWFNIPNSFTARKTFPFIGISKSAPGSNAILTTGNNSGNSVYQVPVKHNFVSGDQVIVCAGATNLGNPSVQLTTTIGSGTGTNIQVAWTAHGFPVGQNIVFPNGGSFLSPGQSYYVCSANLTANTFQISSTLANALAGTPVPFTGNAVTDKVQSYVNHNQYTVGAVTDYTIELLHCDSSMWGAVTTAQISAGQPGQYCVGNAKTPGGWVTTPFDATYFASNVTSMATAVKAALNVSLISKWEFSNEVWNNSFPVNTIQVGQAHNFVNASGTRYFADSQGQLYGYFVATAMNAIRTVYGGSTGWEGILSMHAGTADTVTQGYIGMDKWINDNAPGTTRNRLIQNVATAGYWGGTMYVNNGARYIKDGNAGFIIDPAGVAASQVVVPSNTNLTDQSNLWAYPYLPIIFDNVGGSLPKDLATGLPLDTGGGDNGGALSVFNISGSDASGVMTVSSAVTGPALKVGQTVYGSLNSGVGFNNFTPRKITAMLTGAGGVGTYQTDSTQVQGALNGLSAMDYTIKSKVYWTIPPSTGTTLRFASSIARFTGSISGNTLNVTVPPLAGLPQIAIGKSVGGNGVSERVITGGNGILWTLNGAGQTVASTNTMGAYNPIVLDPANIGSGGIGTVPTFTAGSGYVDGTYNAVPLTGGTGTGALAQIVVLAANVSKITITTAGTGYVVGDVISASAANLGGSGSGFQFTVSMNQRCVWTGSTLFRTYMNDSIAVNISNPATWPSRYSYFDYKINEQLKYATDAVAGGAILPFNGDQNNPAYFPYSTTDLGPLCATSSIMPSPPKLIQYEGANGNYPTGQVPGIQARAMTADPQFWEFLPQACGTLAQASCWTLQDQVWRNLPTYAANTPSFSNNGYSFPLNTTGVVMGQQAFFVDAINVSVVFQFGAVYFCDTIQGYGSPNWQQGLNGHPCIDALAATN